MKRLLFSIAGLAAAVTSQATPYQSELNAAYATGDYGDDDVNIDNDSYELSYRYFFAPVDDSSGALREAAFLSASSYVGIGLFGQTLEGEIDDEKISVDGFSLEGRWVSSADKWIVGGMFRKDDFDLEGVDLDDPEGFGLDTYRIEFGKYLTDKTSLIFFYQNAELEATVDNETESVDIKSYNLSLKHYGALSQGVAYSAEVFWRYFDFDISDDSDDSFDADGSVYGLDFTLYPMRELGIGLRVTQADSLGDLPILQTGLGDGDSFGVHIDWFPVERFGISLAYVDQTFDLSQDDDEDDDFELDAKTVTLRGTVRF